MSSCFAPAGAVGPFASLTHFVALTAASMDGAPPAPPAPLLLELLELLEVALELAVTGPALEEVVAVVLLPPVPAVLDAPPLLQAAAEEAAARRATDQANGVLFMRRLMSAGAPGRPIKTC
jgi:hypothetical protein